MRDMKTLMELAAVILGTLRGERDATLSRLSDDQPVDHVASARELIGR